MNLSTYLFGHFAQGYKQYPDDYTRSIFQKFREGAQARTQVVMHRQGDLMYYGYVRLLENKAYIGLCIVVNGHYIARTGQLFASFEKVIEMMVRNGYFIHLGDDGEIVTSTAQLVDDREALSEVHNALAALFGKVDYQPLPAVDFGSSSLAVRSFTVEDNDADIVASSYSSGYTFLYKSKNFDTASMLSYKGVIARKNKQISALEEQRQQLEEDNKSLKEDLTRQKLKQRNMTWVGVMAVVILILGIVVWNKVLYPDEVTKYDAGSFLYYGPMKNGKPNGTGVAIYPKSDKDGRLYYYGNFTEGLRVDTNAIMFYRDGSYYRGSMSNDRWGTGVFYDVENEHFVGEFRNNQPYKGTWYKHVPVQKLDGDE